MQAPSWLRCRRRGRIASAAGDGPLRTRCAPYPARQDDAPVGCVVRQLIQLAGSLLVLAGFALSQWGVLDPKSRRYLALNAVGSAILAVDALETHQWGFLLLEGVWAVVSTVGLIRVRRRPAPLPPPTWRDQRRR